MADGVDSIAVRRTSHLDRQKAEAIHIFEKASPRWVVRKCSLAWVKIRDGLILRKAIDHDTAVSMDHKKPQGYF